MRDRPPWLRWVIALAVLAILIGVGVRASLAAVQEPYLVQSQTQGPDGWRFALVVVQRNPSSADVANVVKTFAAKHGERPLTAEFYTDGNAAIAFEGGGPADSAATAALHVGEFRRPASGGGQGWADAKGAQDGQKTPIQAP